MINRLEATRYLVEQLSDEPIIASCGNPKFDLFTAAEKRKANFYMWNSMGMASSIGLGLAMACPGRKVIVLDGDGAILSGQPTHTAGEADIEAIARGAGFKQALTVNTFAAFKEALFQILFQPGPWVLVARTDSSKAPGRPPKSPVYIKDQFMAALRGA
jgi:thiamine pyrophosphate-dependent acetolactate synthase large subunit-like protein